MNESQLSTLSPSAINRHSCPRCESVASMQSATAGRPGVMHQTMRCTTCGNIYDTQVEMDPINDKSLRWTSGELQAPT
jgi:phage FluMu protein Com